jgi:hypothetical protein
MIGCFANIRGVQHPDKESFPRELVRDDGVCFLGLNETIKSQYTPQWYMKVAGDRNFT